MVSGLNPWHHIRQLLCEHGLLPRFYTQYGRFFIAGLANNFADDKHPGAYLLHVKKNNIFTKILILCAVTFYRTYGNNYSNIRTSCSNLSYCNDTGLQFLEITLWGKKPLSGIRRNLPGIQIVINTLCKACWSKNSTLGNCSCAK